MITQTEYNTKVELCYKLNYRDCRVLEIITHEDLDKFLKSIEEWTPECLLKLTRLPKHWYFCYGINGFQMYTNPASSVDYIYWKRLKEEPVECIGFWKSILKALKIVR